LLIKRLHHKHMYHMCFLPLYTQSLGLHLTVKSDKQQITQNAPNADVLHTEGDIDRAYAATNLAISPSLTLNFGIL